MSIRELDSVALARDRSVLRTLIREIEKGDTKIVLDALNIIDFPENLLSSGTNNPFVKANCKSRPRLSFRMRANGVSHISLSRMFLS